MRALLQPNVQLPNLTLTTVSLPVPNTQTDEHLIRIHTAAITNGELLWPKNFPVPEPNSKDSTPLYDLAGTVVTAPFSSPFQPGAEVYARADYQRTGCGREYTIAVTSELAFRPKGLSWAEAATVPMSAQTAWQALFVHAGLEAKTGSGARGKRVYVTAASGGVGTWVVQLAKWAGAEVVASCGSESVERVRSLGASEVIDYRLVDIKEWAQDRSKRADIVIDCIGRQSLADAWWLVKPGGTLLSIYQPPEQHKPAGIDGESVRHLFFVMEARGDQLQMVTDLWDEAGFVPALDSVFPLEKFEDAFGRAASGKTKGKVVIDMGVE